MSAENFIFIDFFLLLKLTEVTSTQESVKSFHIDSSTCCNMLLQLATTKFCCVTMFEVGGNTCNNAFQLATQQCCVQVEEKCCSYYRGLKSGTDTFIDNEMPQKRRLQSQICFTMPRTSFN